MKLNRKYLKDLILETLDEAESVDSIYNKEAEGYEDIVKLLNRAMDLDPDGAVELVRYAIDLGASFELFPDAEEVWGSHHSERTTIIVRFASREDGSEFYAFLQSLGGWYENRSDPIKNSFARIAFTGFVLHAPRLKTTVKIKL